MRFLSLICLFFAASNVVAKTPTPPHLMLIPEGEKGVIIGINSDEFTCSYDKETVTIQLNDKNKDIFSKYTGEEGNVGKKINVNIGGRLVSSSVLRARIDSGMISVSYDALASNAYFHVANICEEKSK